VLGSWFIPSKMTRAICRGPQGRASQQERWDLNKMIFLALQNTVVALSKFAAFSTQNPQSMYLSKLSTGVCTYARPPARLFQPE